MSPRTSDAGSRVVHAWAVLLLALSSLVACQKQIGDACTVSTDCSSRGDRLCDTSQVNGYCTVFNCTGDITNTPRTTPDCPNEAVCVLFGASVPGCPTNDRHDPPRTGRTLCLRKCNHDSDCRTNEGYHCSAPTAALFNAVDVSTADPNQGVCIYVGDRDPTALNQSVMPSPVCSAAGPTAPPSACS